MVRQCSFAAPFPLTKTLENSHQTLEQPETNSYKRNGKESHSESGSRDRRCRRRQPGSTSCYRLRNQRKDISDAHSIFPHS